MICTCETCALAQYHYHRGRLSEILESSEQSDRQRELRRIRDQILAHEIGTEIWRGVLVIAITIMAVLHA